MRSKLSLRSPRCAQTRRPLLSELEDDRSADRRLPRIAGALQPVARPHRPRGSARGRGHLAHDAGVVPAFAVAAPGRDVHSPRRHRFEVRPSRALDERDRSTGSPRVEARRLGYIPRDSLGRIASVRIRCRPSAGGKHIARGLTPRVGFCGGTGAVCPRGGGGGATSAFVGAGMAVSMVLKPSLEPVR